MKTAKNSKTHDALAPRQLVRQSMTLLRSSSGNQDMSRHQPMSKPANATMPAISISSTKKNTNGIQNLGSPTISPVDAERASIMTASLQDGGRWSHPRQAPGTQAYTNPGTQARSPGHCSARP